MAGEGEASKQETPAEAASSYRGIIGAFPYAYRSSQSRLFRSYAVVGGLLTALLVVMFAVAIVVAFKNTLGVVGGTFTFSRSFIVFVGFLVAVPVVAPVLLVARRHRRAGSTRTYDRAMAAAGYLYALALYLGLVVSVPPAYREESGGTLAPVVEFLYGLPALAGFVPPVVALVVGYLLHRRYR